jgi:hypothetical protein
MRNDFNTTVNQLETRVSRLEQKTVIPRTGVADIGYDVANNLTTVDDKLDWSMAQNGWEPYSNVSKIIFNSATQTITSGGQLDTPYGRPEAHLIGSMCVLTGVVRRKAGATPAPVPGTRYHLPMFGLPTNWRPVTNIILPCLMGNGDPDTVSVVSTAWIEIRSGLEPLQGSGVVSYMAGNSPLTAGIGWIALQGIFPCHIIGTG